MTALMLYLNWVYHCRHFSHVNTSKFCGFVLEKLGDGYANVKDERAPLAIRKQARLHDVGQFEVQLPLLLGDRAPLELGLLFTPPRMTAIHQLILLGQAQINVRGRARFSISGCQDTRRMESYWLESGDCINFDNKQPHGIEPVLSDRCGKFLIVLFAHPISSISTL